MPCRMSAFSGRRYDNTMNLLSCGGAKIVTLACFRVATFRPATRKHATFYLSCLSLQFVVSLHGEAKTRHTKTRQINTLSCHRMATFRPAKRKHATFYLSCLYMKFVVSTCGGSKHRHAKIRHIYSFVFLYIICRIFAWRGATRKHEKVNLFLRVPVTHAQSKYTYVE